MLYNMIVYSYIRILLMIESNQSNLRIGLYPVIRHPVHHDIF